MIPEDWNTSNGAACSDETTQPQSQPLGQVIQPRKTLAVADHNQKCAQPQASWSGFLDYRLTVTDFVPRSQTRTSGIQTKPAEFEKAYHATKFHGFTMKLDAARA